MFVWNITDLLQFATLLIIVFIFLGWYIVDIFKDWLKTQRFKNNLNTNIKIAGEILSEFEELLSKNNIKIPSQDREGNDDEACIYGNEYYDLENAILEILKKKGK